MRTGVLGRLGRRDCNAVVPLPAMLTTILRSRRCTRVLCERRRALPRKRKSPTKVAVTDGGALVGSRTSTERLVVRLCTLCRRSGSGSKRVKVREWRFTESGKSRDSTRRPPSPSDRWDCLVQAQSSRLLLSYAISLGTGCPRDPVTKFRVSHSIFPSRSVKAGMQSPTTIHSAAGRRDPSGWSRRPWNLVRRSPRLFALSEAHGASTT